MMARSASTQSTPWAGGKVVSSKSKWSIQARGYMAQPKGWGDWCTNSVGPGANWTKCQAGGVAGSRSVRLTFPQPNPDGAYARSNARRRQVPPSACRSCGRHEVRIKTKKLRYTTELFSKTFGKNAEKRHSKFTSSLTRLQNVLGELNDMATARQCALAVAGRNAELAFRAGQVVGARRRTPASGRSSSGLRAMVRRKAVLGVRQQPAP